MKCCASVAIILSLASAATGFAPRHASLVRPRIQPLVGAYAGRPVTRRAAEGEGGPAVDPNEVDMEELKAQRKSKVGAPLARFRGRVRVRPVLGLAAGGLAMVQLWWHRCCPSSSSSSRLSSYQ